MKKMFFLFVVVLAVMFGCTIKKPTLPDWDIDLNLPLLNETYYLSDLVDEENLIMDSNNLLHLLHNGETETSNIGIIQLNPNFTTEVLPVPSGVPISGTVSLQDVETNYEISYGEIAQGVFECFFGDIHPGVQNISLSFGEIRDADGNPLTVQYTNEGEWVSHSLEDYYLGTEGSGNVISDVSFEILATSNQSMGTIVANAQIRLVQTLHFNTFEGRLTNFRIDVSENTGSITLEYPYGLEDALQLTEASLNIRIESELGFECDFFGDLVAKNTRTGQQRIVPIVDDSGNNFSTNPAVNGENGITDIALHNTIHPLLAIMPDEINIQNAYFILRTPPGNEMGRVNENNKIFADYTIDAPFNFILLSNRILIQDPVEIKISEANREQIRKHALYANLDLYAQNELPIGATAYLYFGLTPDFDVNDSTSYVFEKQIHIESGLQNSELQHFADLALTESELDLFDNSVIFLRWAFRFDASVTPVSITASPADFIQVKSMLFAKVSTDGGEK